MGGPRPSEKRCAAPTEKSPWKQATQSSGKILEVDLGDETAQAITGLFVP